MSTFIESLKRLFFDGKITEERLEILVSGGKITAEEKAYIIEPTEPDADEYRQYYEMVNTAVLGGVSDGQGNG